jgi:hypothetical protein
MALRYSLTTTLVVSEDNSSTPTKKIYEDCNRSIVDTTTLTEAGSGFTTYAPSAADVAVPLGGIAAGKWLYMVADAAFSFKLSGGAALVVPADKPIHMFVDFTSLSISNPSALASVSISWALGGSD